MAPLIHQLNHFLLLPQDTLNDDLLAAVFSAVIKDGKIKPEEVDDICVGEFRLI